MLFDLSGGETVDSLDSSGLSIGISSVSISQFFPSTGPRVLMGLLFFNSSRACRNPRSQALVFSPVIRGCGRGGGSGGGIGGGIPVKTDNSGNGGGAIVYGGKIGC
jgi:hypothetical protein